MKFKGITVAEFDRQWKLAKKGLSPDSVVYVTVPYEDGIGAKQELAVNVHSHDGNVFIPATVNQQSQAE